MSANTSVTIIQDDCLNVLAGLEEKSVDLVFADPPFNVGKRYAAPGSKDRREDYYEWCEQWIDECFRTLKDTGSFYLMTLDRHVDAISPMMRRRGVYVNHVHWRNVSANHTKRAFWTSTQPILIYGKTEEYIFNTYAQTRRIDEKNLRWGGYTTGPKGQLTDYWDDIPFVYAGSIAHPEAIMMPNTNRKAHPCQMPVALAARAILFSTNPGAVVLDPFSGSGTVGEACILHDRSYIGIEASGEYVSMINDRLSRVSSQGRMFTAEMLEQSAQGGSTNVQ